MSTPSKTGGGDGSDSGSRSSSSSSSSGSTSSSSLSSTPAPVQVPAPAPPPPPAPPIAPAPAPVVAAAVRLAAYVAAPNSFDIYWEDRQSLTTKAIRVPVGGVELIINLHFGAEQNVWFGFGSAYVRGEDGNTCNVNALTTAAQRQVIRDQIEGDFNTQCSSAYAGRDGGTPDTWR
ncbi:hypothetical protein [Embleya sp. NPDC001921]